MLIKSTATTLLLSLAAATESVNFAQWTEARNLAEPEGGATYSFTPEGSQIHRLLSKPDYQGCWQQPTPTPGNQSSTALTFTNAELAAAAGSAVSIDWRKHGAVTPVQQQHPFGTCWAFSAVAVTEGIMVVQGKQPLQKLSEQMVVSCVPSTYCGQSASRIWSYLKKKTKGKFQLETAYAYNRTCNFFREQLLAPDGTTDGYNEQCNLPAKPPNGPCPPCKGITRRDGTPPCKLTEESTFSPASVQGWAFVPYGAGGDSTQVVAAIQKYGPCQIGIDASCLSGYTSGVIKNCTSANTDHAVTIVGADTDEAGTAYFIVKNSWNTTFGEEGYFRVARSTPTPQMGINGAYCGCFGEECRVN